MGASTSTSTRHFPNFAGYHLRQPVATVHHDQTELRARKGYAYSDDWWEDATDPYRITTHDNLVGASANPFSSSPPARFRLPSPPPSASGQGVGSSPSLERPPRKSRQSSSSSSPKVSRARSATLRKPPPLEKCSHCGVETLKLLRHWRDSCLHNPHRSKPLDCTVCGGKILRGAHNLERHQKTTKCREGALNRAE